MKLSKGITLIELLVVIIVVGLLATIATPMYTNYMLRARRADAKTALEQLRAAQEMRRAERGNYETNVVALQKRVASQITITRIVIGDTKSVNLD